MATQLVADPGYTGFGVTTQTITAQVVNVCDTATALNPATDTLLAFVVYANTGTFNVATRSQPTPATTVSEAAVERQLLPVSLFGPGGKGHSGRNGPRPLAERTRKEPAFARHRARRLVPEVGIEPTRAVKPTGF